MEMPFGSIYPLGWKVTDRSIYPLRWKYSSGPFILQVPFILWDGNALQVPFTLRNGSDR